MPETEPAPPAPATPPLRSESGFSMLEVLIGGILLGLALLTHAASTISEHRLARQQRTRSEVLHAMRQFMGRLKADEDWTGLYARLRALETAPVGASDVGLPDGRVMRLPQTYYSDFASTDLPADLHVHVAVPGMVTAVAGGGFKVQLREDADAPRFGLPADLDGDGAVGPLPLDASYNALPVVVTFHWVPTGEASSEQRISTWLRGVR